MTTTAATPGARSTSAPRTRFGYQPALDGVRAIAIAMVLMLHAEVWSPWDWTVRWSGWLGVDVFFVLSGFLITMLLLQEIDRTDKIALGAFYVRRFLRLYPIIFVALVFAAITMVALPDQNVMHTSREGAASIAFYFTNWLIIARDSNTPLGVFGHLWSLAIEEQFYLVWPIVVLVSVKLGSRRIGPFLAASIGALAAAIHRVTVWNDAKAWGQGTAAPAERAEHLADVGRYWYRSTFTRVDGLLIGCALAVVVVSLHGPTVARLRRQVHDLTGWDDARLGRWARRLVGLLGLTGAIVAEWIVYNNHYQQYPEFLIGVGLPLFGVAVGLVVVNLVVNHHGLMARVLAWRPLVWVGRRSYAIYVLHPLFIIGMGKLFADTQTVRVAAVGVTFLVAGISYRYYEAPILRLKSRFGGGREEPATAGERRPVDAGAHRA